MPLRVYAVVASSAVLLATLITAPSARADTCQTHYTLCVNKYGNPPAVCGCARSLCLKQVGDKDAGPKWNWIPGVNACFAKK